MSDKVETKKREKSGSNHSHHSRDGGGGGGGGNRDNNNNSSGGGGATNNNNSELQHDGSNSSSEYQSDEDYAWIPWFCSLKGNEFLCEVDESYARDGFNLTGLSSRVPFYEYALDMILDIESNDDALTEEQQERVENDAEHLYGLIHARYVLTSRGLHAMMEKYRHFHFGRCPRVLCQGQSMLPVGLSDAPHEDTVKLYCPRCEEVYNCKSSRHEHMDGAYFGTTFPHLFFLTFPEMKPDKANDKYVPRVFGFKVNGNAHRISLEARKQQMKKK